MQSIVSIYKDHTNAVEAIRLLKNKGFSDKHISLLSKLNDEEIADNKENTQTALTGLGIGATVGTLSGVLAGIGLFAIPVLGFLLGAGALAGAVAGFEFGLNGGGLISALAIGGLTSETEKKYQKELEEGKTLLVFQGNEEEIKDARAVLAQQGVQVEMNVH